MTGSPRSSDEEAPQAKSDHQRILSLADARADKEYDMIKKMKKYPDPIADTKKIFRICSI